jgi:hypothetical protein
MGLIYMWPATIELLVIAAVISSIIAFSVHSSAKRADENLKHASAQGHPNSESPINPAAEGLKQSVSTNVELAVGGRQQDRQANQGETNRAAFSGHSG